MNSERQRAWPSRVYIAEQLWMNKSTVVVRSSVFSDVDGFREADEADATGATSTAWRGAQWTKKLPTRLRGPSASPELLRIGMNLEAACFYYGAGGSNGRPSADP
jgi:hypothetical protein